MVGPELDLGDYNQIKRQPESHGTDQQYLVPVKEEESAARILEGTYFPAVFEYPVQFNADVWTWCGQYKNSIAGVIIFYYCNIREEDPGFQIGKSHSEPIKFPPLTFSKAGTGSFVVWGWGLGGSECMALSRPRP